MFYASASAMNSLAKWTSLIICICLRCYHVSGDDFTQVDNPPAATSARGPEAKFQKACSRGDLICEKDRLSYEAIKALHEQLDDDKNGDVDISESEEFLREELQYKSEDRQRTSNFHNNDTHVTLDDLWDMWIHSEVHNWTVAEVAKWLEYHVELPQYVAVFKAHAVDGSSLPRIASNNLGFLSVVLGIKNPVYRQKLSLKAMDVVLFGAPKSGHSFVKDVLLATAIAIAIGGMLLARHEYKVSQQNLRRWEEDISSLQSLQEKLEGEQIEKKLLSDGKRALEAQIHSEMNEAKAEAERLRLSRVHTETELTRLRLAEEELQKVREALADAEKQLELRRGSDSSPSSGPMFISYELQQWLQITYELELRSYKQKKAAADQELILAKEACDKLKKRKNAFLGSLRMVHSSTLDEFECQIVHAKHALEDVKLDYAERQRRWQAIEALSGVKVDANPGLSALASATGHKYLQHKLSNANLNLPLMSCDEADELSDVPPGYAPHMARYGLRFTRINKYQQGYSSPHVQQLDGDRISNASTSKKVCAEQEDCTSLASSALGHSSVDAIGSDRPQFTLYEEPSQGHLTSVSKWSASCEELPSSNLSQTKNDPTRASLPAIPSTSACTAMLSLASAGQDCCFADGRPEYAIALVAAPRHGSHIELSSELTNGKDCTASAAESSKREMKQKEKKKHSIFRSHKGDKPESALKNLALKMAKERVKASSK